MKKVYLAGISKCSPLMVFVAFFLLNIDSGEGKLFAQPNENLAPVIVGGLIGHSLVSLGPAAVIYYANRENAPFGSVYLGALAGGAAGLGLGLGIGLILPSRDPTGFGLVAFMLAGYFVGGFVGANMAYRENEYTVFRDGASQKISLAYFRF